MEQEQISAGNRNSENNQEKASQSTTWSDSLRYISIVFLIILAVFVLYLSRSRLSLILIAALAAYLLSPLVYILNSKLHIKRSVAIILSYIFLFLIVCGVIAIVIPWVTMQLNEFFEVDWDKIIVGLATWLEDVDQNFIVPSISLGNAEIDLTEPLDNLRNWILSFRFSEIDFQSLLPGLSGAAQKVLNIGTNVISQVASVLLSALTAIMASIHFCNDGRKLKGWTLNLFEDKYKPEVKMLLEHIGRIWTNYFAGELKLMLAVGIGTFAMFAILGVRWALLLGIIAGFCEVVPNIGPILACVPAVIIALIFGSSWLPVSNFLLAILVIAASVIVQQVENIFLVPHIMGNALELHPAVIIIGIMILSTKLGVWGAILAAPLIGLAREILRFVIRKIKREDPYPELSTTEQQPEQ